MLYLFIASWGWSSERCSSIRFRPGRIEENETVQDEINSDATWSQTGATLTNGSPDSSRSFTITKWPIFLILYLSFCFPFLFFFPFIHSIHSLSLPGPHLMMHQVISSPPCLCPAQTDIKYDSIITRSWGRLRENSASNHDCYCLWPAVVVVV